MPRGNCYACRNYFTECEEPHHPPEKLLWAKHEDGKFWWGEGMDDAPGRRVRICVWCRDALSEDSEWV